MMRFEWYFYCVFIYRYCYYSFVTQVNYNCYEYNNIHLHVELIKMIDYF